jgi:hypothetical protein
MTEVSDLNNDAVRWSGTRFGLLPTLSQEAEAIVSEGEAVVPTLLNALADADRFVSAHVLLTKISGVEYETFPSWNGLEVDIAADGTVTIDSEQRFELARRWERWFHADPRPKKLPSGD